MKTEGEFNTFLGNQMKKMGKEFTAIKHSDRFQTGISDFMVYGNGKAMALESKFVKELPGGNTLLLKHPFTGPQLTYLESISLSGNWAFGIVGIEQTKRIYAIPFSKLPKEGNWKTQIFLEENNLVFGWNEFDMFVEGM